SNYSYDNANQLTGLSHVAAANTIAQYQWTIDAAGRVTQEVSPDGTTNYGYDQTNQLTGADHSIATDETYSYDASGNRTSAGYQTSTGDRLQSDGKFNYVYDAEGNLTQRRDIATGAYAVLTWDYRNRLT